MGSARTGFEIGKKWFWNKKKPVWIRQKPLLDSANIGFKISKTGFKIGKHRSVLGSAKTVLFRTKTGFHIRQKPAFRSKKKKKNWFWDCQKLVLISAKPVLNRQKLVFISAKIGLGIGKTGLGTEKNWFWVLQ